MADPYSLLGISRSASEAEVKKAYRTLAKELHPDKNKDNPKATERFSEVTRAYNLLTDADQRARFDRGEIDMDGNPTSPFGYGPGGFGGGQARGARPGAGSTAQGFEFGDGADFGDIFEGLFGGARAAAAGGGAGGPFGGFGARAAARKGANVTYRLSVGFVDAATLSPQRITLRDGKTIDLKLAAGVETGTQMRLAGKGEIGPGGSGDAIITIEVQPHPFFERDGDNVRLDLPISVNEAVRGAKVKVPTVDGPVMLAVPPGSASGRTLRLKGKGFTLKDGSRGDQLVTLMIDVPADDSALNSFLDRWQDNRPIRSHFGF